MQKCLVPSAVYTNSTECGKINELGRVQTVILSQHLPRGTEENQEHPGRDSKRAPPEHKSDGLPFEPADSVPLLMHVKGQTCCSVNFRTPEARSIMGGGTGVNASYTNNYQLPLRNSTPLTTRVHVMA